MGHHRAVDVRHGGCRRLGNGDQLLRVAFAFLIMLPLALVRSGAQALRVDAKTLAACALLGIICHGIYNVFYAYVVTLCGVATAAVLLNIAPVFGSCSPLCCSRKPPPD